MNCDKINETRSTTLTLRDKKFAGLLALLDCKRMNVKSFLGFVL